MDLIAANEELMAANAELVKAVEALQKENKILREQVDILRREKFGKKTERFDPDQYALFEAEEPETPEGPAPEPKPKPKPKQKRKGHGRSPFSEQLPRNDIYCDVPEEDRICNHCDAEMVHIGADVTERLEIIPAKVHVNRYTKQKYGCPNHHGIVTGTAPSTLIDRGKYEPSVYAHAVVAKYTDHLPLHRLSGIFKRQHVSVSKQSLWDMVSLVDDLVAKPLAVHSKAVLRSYTTILADETPVTVKREGGKGTFKGYLYIYRTLDGKVVCDFRNDRSRDGPIEFLGHWAGCLLVDGFGGYDPIVKRNGILRAGCLAHARRYVKDALDVGSTQALFLMTLIQRLFRLESAVKKRIESRELAPLEAFELRARVRLERSALVLKKVFAEADRLACDRSVMPKSALGKALKYIINQAEPLSVFVNKPQIPIHNNDTERDIRHCAMGRRAWMIFASPNGGEVAGRLYSLMISCKHAGIDPEAYLRDVLQKIAATPTSRIEELTPWAWAERNPAHRIA